MPYNLLISEMIKFLLIKVKIVKEQKTCPSVSGRGKGLNASA